MIRPLPVRKFATALAAVLCAGWWAGCDIRPSPDAGRAFVLEPSPAGMEVDPALLHWERGGSWEVALADPRRIRVLGSGEIAVLGGGGIEWLLPGGDTGRWLPRFEAPVADLAEMPQADRFLLALPGQLLWIGPDQPEGIEFAVPSGNPWITAVAVQDDRVIVADAGNRRIWAYDFDGKVLAVWGEKNERLREPGLVVPSPYLEVAVDDRGGLWATNPGMQKVVGYGPDGEALQSWGFASARIDGFCGCCNPTGLVALPGDTGFLTVEKGLPRVKQYDRAGNLTGVVVAPWEFEPDERSPAIDARCASEVYVLDPAGQRVWRYHKKAGTDNASNHPEDS